MKAQMTLPFEEFEAKAANDNEPLNRLEARWRDFHAANPHIYKLIEKYAFQAIQSGRERYGMKALFELVRWHIAVNTRDNDGYKLSNSHAPYYARLFKQLHPEHADFFQTKAVKGE